MKQQWPDNFSIASNAARTSAWVWGCFLLILGVIIYVLWIVRFPEIIKMEVELHRGHNLYYVKANIPRDKAASVSPGQSIRLWLNDFSSQEEGYFTGEVGNVHTLNNYGDMEITVDLLSDKTLSVNNKMAGRAGLKGTAVIVLADQRLFFRFLKSISFFK